MRGRDWIIWIQPLLVTCRHARGSVNYDLANNRPTIRRNATIVEIRGPKEMKSSLRVNCTHNFCNEFYYLCNIFYCLNWKIYKAIYSYLLLYTLVFLMSSVWLISLLKLFSTEKLPTIGKRPCRIYRRFDYWHSEVVWGQIVADSSKCYGVSIIFRNEFQNDTWSFST